MKGETKLGMTNIMNCTHTIQLGDWWWPRCQSDDGHQLPHRHVTTATPFLYDDDEVIPLPNDQSQRVVIEWANADAGIADVQSALRLRPA